MSVNPAAVEAADPRYPLLSKMGEAAGIVAGVLVTLVLRLSPKWSKPAKPGESATDGRPSKRFEFQARHEPVVGPRVSERASTMPPGMMRDLVNGFAQGATAAPGLTYELEVRLDKLLQGK